MRSFIRSHISLALSALLVLCVSALVSCEGTIGDAQNFVPNKSPMISSVTAERYDGKTNDTENLISNIVFTVTVKATDPDGGKLSYSYSSDFGSFSTQTDSDTGSTVLFVTGDIKAGDQVVVYATAHDDKNGKSTSSVRVGQAKPVPSFIASPATTLSISRNASAAVSFAVDCDGQFQLICDDSISSPADAHILTSDFVTGYSKSSGTVSAIISGPESTTTGKVKLPASATYPATRKVWIVFIDFLGQETASLCTVTLN